MYPACATIVKIGNDAVLLNQSAVAFGNAIVEWPDHECGMACAELRLARQLPTHPNPVWSGHPAGCTVTRSGSGVEIGYDMPYVEGGCPCGIAIQDNHFIDVNPSSSHSGVIAAHTCTFTQRDVARIENVSVTGNEFDKPLEAAVDAEMRHAYRHFRQSYCRTGQHPHTLSREPDISTLIKVVDNDYVASTNNQATTTTEAAEGRRAITSSSGVGVATADGDNLTLTVIPPQPTSRASDAAHWRCMRSSISGSNDRYFV